MKDKFQRACYWILLILLTMGFGYLALREVLPMITVYLSSKATFDDSYGGDFLEYYRSTAAIFEGKDPYDLQNLNSGMRKLKVAPYFNPAQFIFMMPFYSLIPNTARVLFLFINLASCPLLISFVLLRIYPWTDCTLSGKVELSLKIILYTSIFVRTSPVFYLLTQNQITLIAMLALLGALLLSKMPVRAALLSVSAALKYSITPFFGLILLFKRYYSLCILAIGLYVIWSSIPVLFGHSIIRMHIDYVTHLLQGISVTGMNHYSAPHLFNFIHFEFFKIDWLNWTGKLMILTIMLVALLRERKFPAISFNFLFLASCATMVVSYHRVYDLALVCLLLIILCDLLYTQQRWGYLSMSLGALGLLLVPIGEILIFYSYVGDYLGENEWIYMGKTDDPSGAHLIAPIPAVYCFLLTIYSAILYFFGRESHSFRTQ